MGRKEHITVWELLGWMAAALVCIIVGCPSVRRAHARHQQEIRNWQVETIGNFHVTVTNDTIFMEIGGAK